MSLLIFILIAVILASAGAEGHPDLIRAIRCPVCDYTTSSLVKSILAAHRQCAIRQGKSYDDVTCTQFKEWNGWEESALPPLAKSHEYPTAQFGAALSYVKDQLLPSACSYHVFKAFPVGTSSPQSQQNTPGGDDPATLADGEGEFPSFEEREKARKAEIKADYERLKKTRRDPVDGNYRAAIGEACKTDFDQQPLDRKERMAFWLYNETRNAIFDEEVTTPASLGVNEVFSKRRDYRRVLKMQRYFCGKACGTINRPDGDEGPDTDVERGVLSWNADGEYISRNHIP